ncbi:uncharacterized protein LOC128636430 [Bombina bombina]|uniref:uncharacterized protein LOC128636430 n=1 Tax=Bombina bombina TaxID=8345 RepID=UPI00235AB41E|nr:uncharacterized protein LOC128636430 [Bombina bombina]
MEAYQQQSREALILLCQERDIPIRSKNKDLLIQALVEYDNSQITPVEVPGEMSAAVGGDSSGSGDPLDCYLQTVLKHMGSVDASLRMELITKFYERQAAERQAAALAAERQAAERQAEREYQLQLERLERGVVSPVVSEPRDPPAPRVRAENFPTLEKDGDVDVFLRSFEKVCRQFQLPREQWAKYLTPGLIGPALEAFAELPPEFDQDYDSIKAALQRRYNLTPEVYRKKFRSLQKGLSESYITAVGNLRTAFKQWVRGIKVATMEELEDLIVKEQFIQLCQAGVQEWVLDRKPKTALEAGELADFYTANRSAENGRKSFSKGGSTCKGAAARPPFTKPVVPLSSVSAPSGKGGAGAASGQGDTRRCFVCNKVGHISSTCPERINLGQSAGGSNPSEVPASVLFVTCPEENNHENLQPVTVGDKVTFGLRDTGAEVTMVHPKLVNSESIIPGKTLAVKGIGGMKLAVPMARVYLDWGMGRGLRNVGVSENIPNDVLLGTDLGRLLSLYAILYCSLPVLEDFVDL